MKFKIQFRVGGSGLSVEDEAESTTDFFKKITFYHSLPQICGNCGGTSIVFDHRIAQGFQFYDYVASKIMLRCVLNSFDFSGVCDFDAT